jgi:RNA polymerase sigma-70 factor, ECF subfamily
LYRPLVLFWCRRGGIHGPDAEDVSQEVFAGAAEGLHRFHRNQPGDSFRGWLRGITRNQLILFHRKNHCNTLGEGGSKGWDRLQEVS